MLPFFIGRYMAKTSHTKPLSEAAFILYELHKGMESEANKAGNRFYLGASGVGNPCDANLWYGFRGCGTEYITAKTEEKFRDGHHSEDEYIRRFNQTQYILVTEGENGRQLGFKDHGGWFRGHRDGLFPSISKYGKAIWEHKCSDKWNLINKYIAEAGEYNALKKWNETYYIQAQLYMGYEGVEWHILTCAGSGSRDSSIVVTPFNKDVFEQVRSRAKRIISSDSLPVRGAETPTNPCCMFCKAKKVCFGERINNKAVKEIPAPSCRNCCYITFSTEGDTEAHCAFYGSSSSNPKDLEGFKTCHRFNPTLIDAELIGRMDNGNIRYKKNGMEFDNGENAFTSQQMHENWKTEPWCNKTVNDIQHRFGISAIKEDIKKE